MSLAEWKVQPLAQDYVEVCRSADPKNLYCFTPGLAVCPNGRLIATMDWGGAGAAKLPEAHRATGNPKWVWRGRVFTSDDDGRTWAHRDNFPFQHARPFVAGDSLYILGHSGDLMVVRSDDWGETWSAPAYLTHGQKWHQSACNVHYANGRLYLVMEREEQRKVKGWPVSEIAPVLLRARTGDDLTKRESWTFASELFFHDAVKDRELDGFGVPFYPAFYPNVFFAAPRRSCSPIGWLETNVVQFVDPNHIWFEPKGKTFHLWMRAHTGGTGLAAIAKVVESDDGSMTTMLETVPSEKKIVYVPCPGGEMRFHILYDETTQLYWLLSTQPTDSMTRPDRLPAPEELNGRYNLPNNERRRLQLHFSRNCMDWCFAGLVAVGPVEKASRHYASMAIDGEDLLILSRSGDEQARDAHNTDMITFHKIPDFRRLAY
ncbi:MAG: sialidase family protein [Candidatus Sumerlaeota bacterium]|nr:sialidase family protein [Candidatus Sumerlaeota bacterium]